MDEAHFGDEFPGELVYDEGYATYNPDPLPPDLEFSQEFIQKLGEARGTLGELSGIGQVVQDSRMLLLGPFIRREAVYSSRIEGTYATVSAVYAHEAGERDAIEGVSRHEAQEVLNYVRATEAGLERMDDMIPIHLLLHLHEILMSNVRGSDKRPGKFRNDQRAIGSRNPREARFVPPAAHRVSYEMDLLLEYINDGHGYDPLIDIALAHYQFETIHPFADGNGRMGRLLITLMIDQLNLLPEPFLYFSSYFNRHRDEYIQRLYEVNSHGKWEAWLTFFLDGVIDQSKEVILRSQKLLELRDEYRMRYQDRRFVALMPIVYGLFENPYITINQAAQIADVDYQPARNAVMQLTEDSVLVEASEKQRYKVYYAPEIINVIERPIEELIEDVEKEFQHYRSSDVDGLEQPELGDFVE